MQFSVHSTSFLLSLLVSSLHAASIKATKPYCLTARTINSCGEHYNPIPVEFQNLKPAQPKYENKALPHANSRQPFTAPGECRFHQICGEHEKCRPKALAWRNEKWAERWEKTVADIPLYTYTSQGETPSEPLKVDDIPWMHGCKDSEHANPFETNSKHTVARFHDIDNLLAKYTRVLHSSIDLHARYQWCKTSNTFSTIGIPIKPGDRRGQKPEFDLVLYLTNPHDILKIMGHRSFDSPAVWNAKNSESSETSIFNVAKRSNHHSLASGGLRRHISRILSLFTSDPAERETYRPIDSKIDVKKSWKDRMEAGSEVIIVLSMCVQACS
jgi:hypothetical protein